MAREWKQWEWKEVDSFGRYQHNSWSGIGMDVSNSMTLIRCHIGPQSIFFFQIEIWFCSQYIAYRLGGLAPVVITAITNYAAQLSGPQRAWEQKSEGVVPGHPSTRSWRCLLMTFIYIFTLSISLQLYKI